MRNYLVNVGLLLVMAMTAACGGADAGAVQEASGTAPSVAGAAGAPLSSALNTDYENALPIPMQLALGLFKLEETSAPLSPEQAAALLPLWKAYRSLTNSDTSSPQELNALLKQIQEALSDEQLQAIAGMQLTGQDLAELAQEKNIALGGGMGRPGNLSAEARATLEARRASGQGPGGGFGPGGELPPGMMATPGARQTAIAGRVGNGGPGVSPALVEALIAYLESRIR
jgi:hypothetical protein